VSNALKSIRVGVVVERRKAASQWIDFLWRPVAVLPGEPEATPWTVLREDKETTTFYAGSATIELHRTETTNYRDNLASGSPGLWVVLRQTDGDPPYKVFTVTADPAEGEAMTEAGSDLVEQVAMPPSIGVMIEEFVAEHHVERSHFKRERNRADPEALARGRGRREDGE
jgi:Protein of unknown function (DUF3305)